MRGKVVELTLSRSFCGITPAHAGKSEGRLQLRLRAGDHPRACGEKTEYSLPHIEPKGSPPRMRGKVRCCMPLLRASGITPAHAGKRFTASGTTWQSRDHPRACGEKGFLLFRLFLLLGSPPRMRGKDAGYFQNGIFTRITPAHAGKSLSSGLYIRINGDHPRACGEKLSTGFSGVPVMGSPPRMRGKAGVALRYAFCHRITPAHAGKSTNV